MDYRIFNLRTDVKACDCTWGCTDTRKRFCTDRWLLEKNPSPNRGIETASAACRSDALPVELNARPPARVANPIQRQILPSIVQNPSTHHSNPPNHPSIKPIRLVSINLSCHLSSKTHPETKFSHPLIEPIHPLLKLAHPFNDLLQPSDQLTQHSNVDWPTHPPIYQIHPRMDDFTLLSNRFGNQCTHPSMKPIYHK